MIKNPLKDFLLAGPRNFAKSDPDLKLGSIYKTNSFGAKHHCFGSGSAFDGRPDPGQNAGGSRRSKRRGKNATNKQIIGHKIHYVIGI
jgi:hypothetical protein